VATPGSRDLTSAYSDLVAGVLDARSDAATAAFDAEIALAESEGRLDARTARALRWWQRESLRALVEHSRTALPPALAALDQAQREGFSAVTDAAEAWDRAVGETMGDTQRSPSGATDPAPTMSPAPPSVHEAAPAAAAPVGAPADLRERRRRLIVAGLNPLPRKE
jgi:hypothetical protein